MTGKRHDTTSTGRVAALAILLLTFMPGCARELKPIFEPPAASIGWPPTPSQSRIRYVGELREAADLKPLPKPFAAVGALFLGEEKPARLYGPRAVVRTPDDRWLWIADSGGRCLHVMDLEDRAYRKIAHAGAEPLLSPVDVCTGDAGSIYVCDSENVAIYQYAAAGGAFRRSLPLPIELRRPAAVAWRPETEELFVVDVTAHDIKVLDRRGELRRVLGKRGTAQGEFNFPCDVLVDGDSIWVVDAGNHRVQQLTPDGAPLLAFGQAGDAPGDMALPKCAATDSDGNLYVVDARFENIQIFTRQGLLLLNFGSEGAGPGEFWLPGGIFIDRHDRIWVCDSYNSRIQVFDYISAGPPVDQPAAPPQEKGS